MGSERVPAWRRMMDAAFCERHIWIRAGGRMRGLVLTRQRQVAAAAALAAIALWALIATVGMTVAALSARSSARQAEAVRVRYEALMSGRDARLIAAVRSLAEARARRVRKQLEAAGVEAERPGGQGGPFIAPNDPQARAALGHADDRLAGSLIEAARALADLQKVSDLARSLPLGRPVPDQATSSAFGLRVDPLNGARAFHPGLDLKADMRAPVRAAARGVVAFAGVRSGYGEVVEIEHERGFRTRYAHLSAIRVRQGQSVAAGQVIGAVGSTGRSTGPHLHYEIWRDGRLQNPATLLKVGEDVRQGA